MKYRSLTISVVILGSFCVLEPARADASNEAPKDGRTEQPEKAMAPQTYTGLWVTDGNHVRHELLPTGRYVEARGNREKAYQGRYEIKGNHIDYWDDTGFTADGTFVDADTLHHGGMILRRR